MNPDGAIVHYYVLLESCIVRDANDADGQLLRDLRVGRDRERARPRVEYDAADLRIKHDVDARLIGGRERCRVARTVRDGPLLPVGRGEPVITGRTLLPSGAPGKAAARC